MLDNDYLRDRHMERHRLTWKVYINKKLVCDGFKTRQQAHDFIDTEIKPLMQKEESIKEIEKMNEYNLILGIVNDYEGKQVIRLGLGKPDNSLPDYEGY